MAKLYFRYGAMGSSKTANAIMVNYNYQERGQRALLLKPRLDNRDGARMVASRSGLSAPCVFIEELDDIDVSAYDCLIVDECQFMTKEQVARLADIADDMNVPVICYGLRADFRGELFEGSKWLLAWADAIEEIKTVCWCGRKATFNTRIVNGRVTKEGEQILLGGSESYVALCRKHWRMGQLAPMEIKKLKAGKQEYTELLLMASPDMDSVETYLDMSDMYVLSESGQVVSQLVIMPALGGDFEIKNLSTLPSKRRAGRATRLIDHVKSITAPDRARLFVTTPADSAEFFRKCGFVEASGDAPVDGMIRMVYLP